MVEYTLGHKIYRFLFRRNESRKNHGCHLIFKDYAVKTIDIIPVKCDSKYDVKILPVGTICTFQLAENLFGKYESEWLASINDQLIPVKINCAYLNNFDWRPYLDWIEAQWNLEEYTEGNMLKPTLKVLQ